jgi:hypothetical protein
VSWGARDDLMLVRIEPPIKGRTIGSNVDLDTIALATRHRGFTLFPPTEWPSYVHCARILVEAIPENGVFPEGALEVYDWAALCLTEEDARSHRIP